jgi:hypothetical protein
MADACTLMGILASDVGDRLPMTQVTTAAGVQVSYSDKKISQIERNMHALLASIAAANLMVGFQLSQSLHVLGTTLRIEGVDDESTLRDLIFNAGVGIYIQPEVTLPKFIEAIGNEAKRYLDRPVQEFHILLPLNATFQPSPENSMFLVMGVALELCNWNDVRARYKVEDLVDQANEFFGKDIPSKLWNPLGTPLIVKVRDRTGEGAFEKVERAYDLFRAVLNYRHDMDQFQLQRPEPLAIVPAPSAYGVFLPDGNLHEQPLFNLEHVRSQYNLLTVFDPQGLSKILTKFKSNIQKNSTTRIFIEALISYGRALDTANWADAYLALWQALEIMTYGTQTKYNMGNVVDRVRTILRGDDLTTDFLNMCADRRNRFVHRAQFSSDGQSEAILLKLVVRRCLMAFYNLMDSYATESSLNEYFAHASMSNDALTERKRVIENILGNA